MLATISMPRTESINVSVANLVFTAARPRRLAAWLRPKESSPKFPLSSARTFKIALVTVPVRVKIAVKVTAVPFPHFIFNTKFLSAHLFEAIGW
jgi:hypothetical protein